MKRIIVIGAGNVGVCAAKAILEFCDLELSGFVRTHKETVVGFENYTVKTLEDAISERPDGAVICVPSEKVKDIAEVCLKNGINTVDAYDMHENIGELRQNLNALAKQNNAASVTGAGWDPGLDSALRTLFHAAVPNGETYTNFGPGMSMGHTAAVKNIAGVKDAISVTEPLGNGKHRRVVYVVLKPGANKEYIEHMILGNDYFEHDETKLNFTDDISAFFNTSHGVEIVKNGEIFGKSSQAIKFDMRIDNPSVTGMLMASAMRASFRLTPGAYFFNEIPPSYFIEKEDIQVFI